MPIPFPRPNPNPPVNPAYPPVLPPRTSQWLGTDQDWAHAEVRDEHVQALNLVGEYSMYVLLWRVTDFELGLVARCPVCYAGSRSASVYGQSTDQKCPGCFGTTFEGGYRAKIVRPTIWTDNTPDTRTTPRGVLDTDTSMSLETTEDFIFHHGDYVFRVDGQRFQGQEISTTWMHTGFGTQDPLRMIAGTIPRVALEDKSSVAYLIPPTDPTTLTTILTTSAHYPPDFSSVEDIRGPLV